MQTTTPKSVVRRAFGRTAVLLSLTLGTLIGFPGCFSDQVSNPPCGPQAQYEDTFREVMLTEAELPASTIDSLQANSLLTQDAKSIELVEVGSTVIQAMTVRTAIEQLFFRSSPDVQPTDMERLVGLPNLKLLDLTGCNVNDAFMIRLEGAPALEDLRLSGSNALTLIGMEAIAKLTTLRRLDLADCGISGQWLGELAKLPNLEYLNLSGNTSLNPESLGQLRLAPALRELELTSVGLTNAMLAEVATFTGLEWLSLAKNTNLTQQGLEPLAAATSLRFLDLSECTITSAWLPELAKLTQLEELRLTQAELSDTFLSHLTSLSNLKRLVLSQVTGIGAPGMLHLRNITSLESLDLNATSVGDAGLGHLRQLHNLKRIVISTGYTSVGITHLTELPALEHVEIVGNVASTHITALSFIANLKVLRIVGGTLSDSDMLVIRRLSKLRRLSLHHCDNINGSFIDYLVSSGSCLERLTLSSCNGVTTIHTANFPKLRNLTRLELVNGTPVSGLMLRRAALIGPLERLNLEQAGGEVSDTALRDLIQTANLHSLRVDGYLSGRGGAVDFLRAQRPAIAIRYR